MKLVIDILGCTLDTLTMAYLYHKTFKGAKVNKKTLILLYFISWVWLLTMSLNITTNLGRMLLSVDVFIPLFSYSGKWYIKGMMAIIYLAVGVLAEMFAKALSLIFYGDLVLLQANFIDNYIFGVMLSRALVFLFVYVIVMFVKIKDDYISFALYLPILLLPTSAMFFLHNIKNTYYRLNTSQDYIILLSFVTITIIGNLIILILTAKVTEIKDLKTKLIIGDRTIKEQSTHYDAIESQHKIISEHKHDLKHLLLFIDKLPKKEAHDHIQKILNDLSGDGHITTGNNPIDAIINNTIVKAGQQKTSFDKIVKLSDKSKNKDKSIFIIIANCLDNALEATAKIPDPNKRWIKLKIEPKGDLTSISVINSVGGKVNINNGKITTSKQDKLNHGHGLNIIKKIVNNNDGVINLQSDNDTFKVDITI